MSQMPLLDDSVMLTQVLSGSNEINSHKVLQYEEEKECEEDQQEELVLIRNNSVCNVTEKRKEGIINYSDNNNNNNNELPRMVWPHSPFRFASTIQFHNKLRQAMLTENEQSYCAKCSYFGLTAIDGLCHEWPELSHDRKCKKKDVLDNMRKCKHHLTLHTKESHLELPRSALDHVKSESAKNKMHSSNELSEWPSMEESSLSLLHRVAVNDSVLSELIDAESEMTNVIIPTTNVADHHCKETKSINDSNKYDILLTSEPPEHNNVKVKHKVPCVVEFVQQLRSSWNNCTNEGSNESHHARKRRRSTVTQRANIISIGDDNNDNNSIRGLLHSDHLQESAKLSLLAWQLVVDHREKINGSHEDMLKIIRRHGKCNVTSASLPAGDFMISVNLENTKEREKHDSNNNTVTIEEREEFSSGQTKMEGSSDTPASLLYSHLVPIIVERKTLEDITASVKDGRYYEQRRLLEHSPFVLIIWLIEGEMNKTNRYKRFTSKQSHIISKKQTNTFVKEKEKEEEEEEEESVASEVDEVWEVESDIPTFITSCNEENRLISDMQSNEESNCESSNYDTAKKRNDNDEDDDACKRRIRSVIASLASSPFRLASANASANSTTKDVIVVQTRNVQESAVFLSELACYWVKQLSLVHCTSDDIYSDAPSNHNKNSDTDITTCISTKFSSFTEPSLLHVTRLLHMSETFQTITEYQRRYLAWTAPVRMLMCIRGCSSALACLLLGYYGTILNL